MPLQHSLDPLTGLGLLPKLPREPQSCLGMVSQGNYQDHSELLRNGNYYGIVDIAKVPTPKPAPHWASLVPFLERKNSLEHSTVQPLSVTFGAKLSVVASST